MHLLISNPCILIVTESRFTEVKLLLTGLPIIFLLALAFYDTVNPQNTLKSAKRDKDIPHIIYPQLLIYRSSL